MVEVTVYNEALLEPGAIESAVKPGEAVFPGDGAAGAGDVSYSSAADRDEMVNYVFCGGAVVDVYVTR